jgi:hypothetical protein
MQLTAAGQNFTLNIYGQFDEIRPKGFTHLDQLFRAGRLTDN